MSYLNFDLDYFTHPKIMRLLALLGKGSEVLPIKLWCYCGKYHSENGKLIGYSIKEIETIIGWWGGEGELVEAFIKVNILEKIENGFKVHDWMFHEGHLKYFKIRAKKAAQKRWEKIKCYKHTTSNAKPMLDECPKPTVPNRTKPNKVFIKPTPAEVTEYAKSIGFDLDGQYFFDTNEAKGWLVGKTRTPMKDWKASVRTWNANRVKFDGEKKAPGIAVFDPNYKPEPVRKGVINA